MNFAVFPMKIIFSLNWIFFVVKIFSENLADTKQRTAQATASIEAEMQNLDWLSGFDSASTQHRHSPSSNWPAPRQLNGTRCQGRRFVLADWRSSWSPSSSGLFGRANEPKRLALAGEMETADWTTGRGEIVIKEAGLSRRSAWLLLGMAEMEGAAFGCVPLASRSGGNTKAALGKLAEPGGFVPLIVLLPGVAGVRGVVGVLGGVAGT